ncbi:MAG: methyl-accepting chemotaxis sensory transducer [Xanthobacteraceae bacterium]|nr:MAG: methyl-accepting chemotaxis sensory transducer [Xanthobacteraceae bacterium]
MKNTIHPTGREVSFDNGNIIVSKTDLKGRICYANRTFYSVSGFDEREVDGQPHSIIRHPDMPRAVFKLLWDRILGGDEIFAYVKNMTRSGDHYWVFAHVTPSFDTAGNIAGFHSNRRVPRRSAVGAIEPLYDTLSRIEASHRNAREGLEASSRHLSEFVTAQRKTYDEIVLAL